MQQLRESKDLQYTRSSFFKLCFRVTNPELANVLVLLSLDDADKELVKAAQYGNKR